MTYCVFPAKNFVSCVLTFETKILKKYFVSVLSYMRGQSNSQISASDIFNIDTLIFLKDLADMRSV